jgi:hypothetical protein
MEIVVVMMKSGIAQWDGKRMPSLPLFAWIWLMYSECSGTVCMESRVLKNELIILLSPCVRGPFHASHAFGSKSSGRWCMMSAPSRCGSF